MTFITRFFCCFGRSLRNFLRNSALIFRKFCSLNNLWKTKYIAMSLSEHRDESLTCRRNPLEDYEKLEYEICRFSSFSPSYFPENVLIDCPSDQTSRWSAQTNNPPQYLTLKLKRPSIVKKIKFGKFEKSHVCNLKKFRIYGGLEEEPMVLLLEGGLKNDSKPEVFNLRCITEDCSGDLPILYLKIVPLLSWGPTFNFSIWYIELLGQDDPMFTSVSMRKYNMLREVEIIKLCLKHFRQQGYEAAFKALQEETKVCLENPLISELHQCLVTDGNFDKAEEIITQYISDGLMDDYLNRQDYKHVWSLQHTQGGLQPGTRGGHQLVIDTQKRLVYLFGGWDGFRDLSDLWVFDINTCTWSLLFENSEQFNGPTPRSCHKMIFDSVSENIFMLGRYLDNSIRTTEYIKSDFFLYDTRARTWLQICDDTSQVGGPHLVYDHQMCIDVDKRTIYVFGGKILTPRSVTSSTSNEPEYSGLFAYHIATNTWTQILVDCHHPSAAHEDVLSIKSRITHCMVFHSKHRKLYIYGGQRGKEDIDEFITYDVDTQAVCAINKDPNSNEMKNEPSPGYTLRATIDCDRDEIYVFSSLSKQKDRRDIPQMDSSNSFWVYSLRKNKWSRIYICRHTAEGERSASADKETLEPCPRYAHQLVYDDTIKIHYLFGGNPGRSNTQLRLDDFWVLALEKPKRSEILEKCRYLVRKLHYEEMTKVDPKKAMHYLRTNISEIIDHSNAEQLKKFHKLASLLFMSEDDAAERSLLITSPIGTSSDIDVGSLAGSVSLDSSETANNANNLSIESSESYSSTSSMSENVALNKQFQKLAEKRPRTDYSHAKKSRRAYLFNKIVQLMPEHMVQPERNLSDFITI